MIWMLIGLVVAAGVSVALAIRRRVAVRAWDAELDAAFARDATASAWGRPGAPGALTRLDATVQ